MTISVTVPLATGGIGFNLQPTTPVSGDLEKSGTVDLTDAILAIQVLSDMPPNNIHAGADHDSGNKIGLAEVIYIFQALEGMRKP